MSEPVFQTPYPVNLDVRGRRVLVVGGGPVAARKVAGLLRAGAVVTVVAPDAVPEIAEDPDVRWHAREYRRGEVASYRLAVVATDDPAVNTQVARDGEAANVFVNAADDPANCSFILPAVVRRGDLLLTVSTNGRSPAFARWSRRHLEDTFTVDHGRVVDVLSGIRDEAREVHGTTQIDGWDEALDDGVIQLILDGDVDDARKRLRAALGLVEAVDPSQGVAQ